MKVRAFANSHIHHFLLLAFTQEWKEPSGHAMDSGDVDIEYLVEVLPGISCVSWCAIIFMR